MIALNKGYTISEYQADQTSPYLQRIKGTSFRHLQSATVIRVSGTTSALSPEALKMLDRLEEFKSLRDNWDSYNAACPSKTAIRQAEKMVRRLDREGMPFFFTAPGPNGEVVLELKRLHKAVEIYFYADAPSDFILFDNDQIVEEGTTESNLQKIIQFFQ